MRGAGRTSRCLPRTFAFARAIQPPTAACATSTGPAVRLFVTNRQRVRSVDLRWLRRLTKHVLTHLLGVQQAELGVHLVTTDTIAQLNQRFLSHAGPTDVISFDYTRSAGGAAPRQQRDRARRPKAPPALQVETLWGDIVICVEQAVLQARRFKTCWPTELARYLVHGLLHLMGYDDSTPTARRQMKQQEDRLLRQAAQRIPLQRLVRPKRAESS
jgi:probable rRNA maturation factor